MSFPVPIDFSRPILVLTDFDGTLAPIVDRPEDARAEPVCRAALVRLHRAAPGMVRVVTGREVSVFDTLINDGVAVEDQLVLPVYGGHGTQQRDANGRIGALDMSVSNQEALETIKNALRDFCEQHGVPEYYEEKQFSAAVHTRRIEDADKKARFVADLEVLLADLENGFPICGPDYAVPNAPVFQVLFGHEVYEIKPFMASKGYAVNALMKDFLDATRPVTVLWLGDDFREGGDGTDASAACALRVLAKTHDFIDAYVGLVGEEEAERVPVGTDYSPDFTAATPAEMGAILMSLAEEIEVSKGNNE